MKINEQEKKALTGFHAITGNDYISSFFRKGKRKCVGLYKQFMEVSEALFIDIEEYICAIYNVKKKQTVNPARAEIFTKKHANENKIIDLSFLPPCESTLLLHVKRANYMTKVWKTSLHLDFMLPNIQKHVWLDSGAIQWVDEVFPGDYRDCLNMDTEIACVSDTETDSERDSNNLGI